MGAFANILAKTLNPVGDINKMIGGPEFISDIHDPIGIQKKGQDKLIGAKEEFIPDPLGNEFTGTIASGAFDGTQAAEKKIKQAGAGGRRRRGSSQQSTSLAEDSGIIKTLLGG